MAHTPSKSQHISFDIVFEKEAANPIPGESMFSGKSIGYLVRVILLISVFSSVIDVSAQGMRQKLSASHPDDNAALIGKKAADVYYHLGLENIREPSNSDFAVEQLSKAISLDETNAEYHFQLAEAYLMNSEGASLFRKPFIAPKIKDHLELAVQYDPSSIRYREALIQYYVFAPGILGGSYVKAHEQADQIARRDAYLGMLADAGIFTEEGEGARSLSLYRRAMHAQPRSWQAYQQLGTFYLNDRQADSAIALFKRYIDVAPDRADAYNCLGQAYQQKKMYAGAISAFQKALEKDASLSPLVFRIAQLYEFEGANNLAREQYQRYLSMVPRGRAAEDAREKIRLLAR